METFSAGQPVSEETFDAFSPKFSALYSLLQQTETGSLGRVNLNLYVAYSEAFKPPRSPSGLNPPGEDANLDPENITNYEVGLKSSLLDGRATLQTTYFQMERDGIVVSTQQGPFFLDSNAGKQDFEGLELAAAWAPQPNLAFYGNVAFYKNRFGEFVIEGTGPDVVLTGNRLPAVPDRIFNLGGSYQHTDELGFTLASNTSATVSPTRTTPFFWTRTRWSTPAYRGRLSPCGSRSLPTTCSTNGTLPPGARTPTR